MPFFLLLLQSCLQDEPPYSSDSAEDEVEYKVFDTPVSELSGLCFTKDHSSLLAVSDGGKIFEIALNGTKIRQLPYTGNNDFEGITMNNETGEIFLADETEMTVYKLSANETAITEVVKINIPDGISNKGIEGIAYHNDLLYIVNQEEPTRMFVYAISIGAINSIDISFAQFLSDICYDSSDNTLWIADSRSKKIFHCKLNGDLISYQSIDYIAKSEALALSRHEGYMWIGCDTSGKLYKVKIMIP
jgi:uncharacterized protein YjiK